MTGIPRSILFVPGNRPDMFARAAAAPADALMPDMEDAVAPADKGAAREAIAAGLDGLCAGGLPVFPRLNSLGTGLFELDLDAVAGPRIAGVSVGKARHRGDIRRIDTALGHAERRYGLRAGSLKLIPWVETAGAIVDAYGVCSASPRVVAVCFGAEDYSNDIGVPKDLGGWQASASSDDPAGPALVYARGAVVAGSVAAGVGAIDTPYVAFRDDEGLAREVALARSMGFDGKCGIHPAQLETINAGFSPTVGEVAAAERIIAAADEAEAQGRGATSLDGKMIDRPTIVRARNLLARVRD